MAVRLGLVICMHEQCDQIDSDSQTCISKQKFSERANRLYRLMADTCELFILPVCDEYSSWAVGGISCKSIRLTVDLTPTLFQGLKINLAQLRREMF